jgi:hypothetical protein
MLSVLHGFSASHKDRFGNLRPAVQSNAVALAAVFCTAQANLRHGSPTAAPANRTPNRPVFLSARLRRSARNPQVAMTLHVPNKEPYMQPSEDSQPQELTDSGLALSLIRLAEHSSRAAIQILRQTASVEESEKDSLFYRAESFWLDLEQRFPLDEPPSTN